MRVQDRVRGVETLRKRWSLSWFTLPSEAWEGRETSLQRVSRGGLSHDCVTIDAFSQHSAYDGGMPFLKWLFARLHPPPAFRLNPG
ncbi:hypothetical protein CA85_34620 [Allorhodopirellula solitaria]|uniref:Uncharacterized protein n=1 Tax=Allorhodopirellula solitaria TaxID=2527987 RepID=A0A5C5XSY4_9BACT|nr:hypothetical protein CA85_34620 [Allorhodopirellula solitaria]